MCKDLNCMCYDDHSECAARIRELEAEIVERRMDYGEDCKRLDARIAELEQQLAAAQEQLTDPTGHGWRNVEPRFTEEGAERDGELSVGVQAEIGYTPPETVEQRLRRKGWM